MKIEDAVLKPPKIDVGIAPLQNIRLHQGQELLLNLMMGDGKPQLFLEFLGVQ